MHAVNLLWPLAALAGVGSARPQGNKLVATPSPTYSKVTTTPIAWSANTIVPFAVTTPTAAAATAVTTTESVSIATRKPANAVTVPGDFIGFGFETAFLNDYANAFSQNIVNSVAKRLGQTLKIRVGGTSGDRLFYDPNQAAATNCIAGDCPTGSGATFILGPSYFNGFKSFPNQQFTFQVPLGPVLNTTNVLAYATNAYQAAGASHVAAIAIGNEVDLYKNYTSRNYVDAAQNVTAAIRTALKLGTQRFFEVVDQASGGNPSTVTIPKTFGLGLDNNTSVKYAAQHWYQWPSNIQTYTPQTLQAYLMNHSGITTKFNNGYGNAKNYIASNDPAVSYIISESGSSLAGPPDEIQAAFGATLWNVDFFLYGMSQGVKRIDGTQRPATHHSYWVPDSSANAVGNIGPQVRAPYFATPFAADFIGTSSGAVTNILAEDTRTAYALYNPSTGALSRVALVNLNYWSADTGGLTGGPRGSTTFNLNVGTSVKSVTVKRLHADAGAHAQGIDVQGANGTITWAGETWSYSQDQGLGHFVTGVAKSQTVTVTKGIAKIAVPDSEAVIVTIS